jgi:ABC-type transport system involved in multi-copper enzyme maturation permease subunit
MNTITAFALVKDAFYQVLDNLVFRLLVLASIVMVAPAFLIAIKPEGIDILFGAWKFTYADLGVRGKTLPPDFHVHIIQGLQSAFTEQVAGGLGIVICLAATAFFVPRMLEKGEADTLFSKPVGRFVLLASRYATGVMFVGVLAFVMVAGIHLGLLIRSGYSDPGFLWSAVTLVYVFALVHAFSTCVGVFTRSSVAALLLAIVFFACNGCSQSLWVGKEHRLEKNRLSAELNEDGAGANKPMNPWVKGFYLAWDGLHFVLPKTRDADVLTRKLRLVVAGESNVVADTSGTLSIEHDPKDLHRVGSGRNVDLSTNPAIWITEGQETSGAKISVTRHSRVVEKKSGDKVRPSRTSARAAAEDMLKSMENQPDVHGQATRIHSMDDTPVHERVTWTEQNGGDVLTKERGFLASGDWMYAIDFEASPAWLAQPGHEGVLTDFYDGLKPQLDTANDLDPDDWYEKHFGWTAPLRYNAFFSLGSSILFAVVMLLIAQWRLSRIDF